jgi:recombination protein RecR
MEQQYSSVLFDKAVEEFAKLPGIGRKTAIRLTLNMLRRTTDFTDSFCNALTDLRHNIKYCRTCHNISDTDECAICASPSRKKDTICVVESIQDVMAIEATTQYNGLYHVLGGIISPIDGIGPNDIEIPSLIERIENGGVKEVIFALNSTMEGDTTNFFIYRKLSKFPDIKLTTLARGISVNDELQYTDEVTLGSSIINRVPFNG